MVIITLMLNTKIHLAVLTVGLLLSAGANAEDNPHWNKTTCQTCHMESAPVDGIVNLNETDAEALCEGCHGDRGGALPCRHASGLPVGDLAVGENLRDSLKDGKVVCSTCHDIVYQCERPRVEYSFENPGFLRDRTSRRTGEYCFKCHDSSDYEKLSPHQGISGMPPRPTCSLCHESIPGSSEDGELNVAFNMRHDLNDTCRGCHNVRPHPRNLFAANTADEWVHLVVPSDKILSRMQEAEAETGTVLPLSPVNGEIFCATCHNPHDFKVGGGHGSEESGMKHRLRTNNICLACHDK